MYYKAPDNSLHDDMGGTATNLLPAGSRAITDEEAAQTIASSIVQPTHLELATKAKTWARSVRLDFFKILDGLQISAVVTEDAITAQAIETAKQALRDITVAVDLTNIETYAEMEQAFIYAYWQIRVTVPANVQAAFNALVP